MAGQPKSGQILAVQPKFRPFFGHFGTPPKNGRRPIRAAISPTILGSGPVSHSVAGQPIRKTETSFCIVQNYCVLGFLGGRFGYFYFFRLGGEGKGEFEAPGGRVGFLLEPRSIGGGGLPKKKKGPGGCLRGIGGGGPTYCFSGPKFPASFIALTLQSLPFSISLLFLFSDFPCFFVRFPLFSKDFRGSAKRKTLAFLGKNPCFFSKKARIGGSGCMQNIYRNFFAGGRGRLGNMHRKLGEHLGANIDSQEQQTRPELQDWLRFEVFVAKD